MKKWMVIVISAILLLAGCSSKTTGSNSANVSQELTYASTSDVVGLSPILTNDSVSANVIMQVYETLFKRNPKTMQIEPLLAESYTNPNDKTWEITLKKGIKFQDGTDFNAEAVKYTFDKFRDPKTAAPRASLLEPIQSVNVIDDYKVEIKTKYPYGPLLAALAHTAASIVSPTADKNSDLMKTPVGTGPFKFVSWTPGDQIVLEANKDYWNGAPKLKKVTFKVVPEVSTAISMLQTGKVQFIDALPAEQIKRLESIKNVKVTKAEGTPVYYLGFNMKKAPMNNLAFRQAVAYGLDRKAYINQLNGLGVEGNSVIGPKVFGYDQSEEEVGYSYDLEKAKKLIKDNGFEGKEVKMLVPNRDMYMKMAEIAQSQMTEIGLKVKLETMEWGTFLDAATKGQYDVTFLGWANSTADGSELLYPNFHSDNVGSSNRISYSNKQFDQLVNESRQTIDQNARKEKLKEADELLVKDAPVIVMNQGVVTSAVDQSVKGIEIDPTGQWSLYNVHRE
ncbi:glutathione ABC transporter substrate-binding protein [Gottfriedia sp. NPDC057991]|uniref:glutathione ABC transporter substrate-binding protein n=1 Tax=Gottfriedia sp. NPDC057991 TaxID=3346298 RepID=UPI0036DBB644